MLGSNAPFAAKLVNVRWEVLFIHEHVSKLKKKELEPQQQGGQREEMQWEQESEIYLKEKSS